jgi:hypothetical protein
VVFVKELESLATLRSKTLHFYAQKFLFIYSSTTYMTHIRIKPNIKIER